MSFSLCALVIRDDSQSVSRQDTDLIVSWALRIGGTSKIYSHMEPEVLLRDFEITSEDAVALLSFATVVYVSGWSEVMTGALVPPSNHAIRPEAVKDLRVLQRELASAGQRWGMGLWLALDKGSSEVPRYRRLPTTVSAREIVRAGLAANEASSIDCEVI